MRNFNIQKNIKEVVVALVEQDKINISTYCQKGYLEPEYLFQEIAEYPGKIMIPPENAFLDYQSLIIDADNTVVWFNLWFDNKKSDLVLEILITSGLIEQTKVIIRGLRVM